MMMMMMMMMQICMESNESSFVRQLVVNSSLTEVYVHDIPENINTYLVQVLAHNSVASSPPSSPVLVGVFTIHMSCFCSLLFAFFSYLQLCM